MDIETRTQLEQVLAHGSPTYRETARALLASELVWPETEIRLFLDGYMNDPYLTRNN